MYYEKAPRFSRSKLDVAPPPLRCCCAGASLRNVIDTADMSGRRFFTNNPRNWSICTAYDRLLSRASTAASSSRRIDQVRARTGVVHCGRLEKSPDSEQCRGRSWGLSLSPLGAGSSLEPVEGISAALRHLRLIFQIRLALCPFAPGRGGLA